jgi:predicted DNA-binding transcriptional regulator YafY
VTVRGCETGGMVNRTKSQFARLMELDRRIREGRYPNCLTFGAEWEVSQKTVQRDVDYLRDRLGAPIGYDRERKGFFYENQSWVLPSVVLNEGELVALLLAARTLQQYQGTPVAAELERLFGKLSQLLPDSISIKPEDLFTQFTFRLPPARSVNPDIWRMIVRGLTMHRRLRVQYARVGTRGVKPGQWSVIEPVHLANLGGEWYLFARHQGHDDLRQFALARFQAAEVIEAAFVPPADEALRAQLDNAFGRFISDEKEQEVRLLFTKEVADWVAERQWHPSQRASMRKDGSLELRFRTRGMYEVERWVLSWGGDVRVLGPEGLRQAVARVHDVHHGVRGKR